jgi:lipopolysaccharide/colanic/teichoic acid biosynthesis glycosyltransferase
MNSPASNQIPSEQSDHLLDESGCGSVPVWKRILDCTLIIASAPLSLPLGLVLGVFVKLVSPGPVLFRQERVGHLGKRFQCFKFRTMKVNADTTVHRDHLQQLINSNQPMRKLDQRDSRLIAGGVWLRTLGLDELPQLLNVLRGEMSLVGPRPTTCYEYEMFLPRHRQRCLSLPGLTGLWQVNGKNRTTFEKMMEWDICYVANKSVLLDLQIIASTPTAILLQFWDAKVKGRLPLDRVLSKNPRLRSGIRVLTGAFKRSKAGETGG